MKGGRRWLAITLMLVAGVLVAGWVVTLRSRNDARALLELLPPDADAYAVLDLDILQSNPAVKRLLADPPNAPPTEEYQELLRQSGFRYQDDLRKLVAAKIGQDWVGAAIVDVERQRLISYLQSQGAQETELNGRTVYSFGSERPFRLVFLDDRTVAFTIGADPAHLPKFLNDMLDRRTGPSGLSAKDELSKSGLLARYAEGSGLWVVGRIDRLAAGGTEAPGIQRGRHRSGIILVWVEKGNSVSCKCNSAYIAGLPGSQNGNGGIK